MLAFTSQFAIMSHHIEMMLAQEGEEGVAAAATGEDGFGGLQPLHEVGERGRGGGYILTGRGGLCWPRGGRGGGRGGGSGTGQ